MAESLHRQLGLTDDEFARIQEILGRDPSDLELAMYGVLWSEHCSYKSSKIHLKRLPTEGRHVLVGPGEGAGVVDIGDGWAVALRIESHNHPSAVEPYQGAATGVGGIIRDIFSMGARPIALMDPLRFGDLDDARTRYLFEGVISGISGYGNAVGVPTVGGEVVFDNCYQGNPLVNVLCLGLMRHEDLILARASGEGNLAVLVGSSTGRDGIGGASVLASAGFAEGSQAKRPSVQVGDPLEEKKLIEACLEILQQKLAVGVQDLGAAGICCATSESAANANAGMDVDVARISRREPNMNPVEVMTSESQERMLVICTPENLKAVLEVCDRWEVGAQVIGRVNDSDEFRVFDGLFDAIGVPGQNPMPPIGEEPHAVASDAPLIADVLAKSLGDGPVYDRQIKRPDWQDALQADDPWPKLQPFTEDLTNELYALLNSPTIADKSWVWRQYDHQLFLNTVAAPGADAAVLRVKETGKALAISTDGKARFCKLDPRTGAKLALLEAVRNVSCAGGRPLAMVNNMNFGNPEHPEVMWQFSEAIDGLAEVCKELGIPVIGGNVSFYNESHGSDIDPTPIIAVLGLIDELETALPGLVLNSGDKIIVFGATAHEIGGSEWAHIHGLDGGMPPQADVKRAAALHDCLRALVNHRYVTGVHDCSEGGLAVALAEMAINGKVGFRVNLAEIPVSETIQPAAACFSETTSRAVLSVHPSQVDQVLSAAAEAWIPAAVIGEATGDRLFAEGTFDLSLGNATEAYTTAIPSALHGESHVS